MSVSFFRWGSLIPLKVTFQGLGGLLKSKLCPVFIGISANQSDVSFLRNKKVGIRQKNNLKRRPIFAKLLVTLH